MFFQYQEICLLAHGPHPTKKVYKFKIGFLENETLPVLLDMSHRLFLVLSGY